MGSSDKCKQKSWKGRLGESVLLCKVAGGSAGRAVRARCQTIQTDAWALGLAGTVVESETK